MYQLRLAEGKLMGGKVLKPKIQAYVEQQWFDEFEVYRASHNLNQSKALEKILAEFFSGSSSTASPSDELNTTITPTLIDTLRAELAELKQEVEQRLELVESRLAIESAAPLANSASGLVHSLNGLAAKSVIHQFDSADILNESALPLTRLATESAALSIHSDATPTIPLAELAAESVVVICESAINSVVGLNRLVAESVAKSAVELAAVEAIAINTLGGNLEPATVSSALAEATTALDKSIESAASSANKSAIVEDAIALNPLEDTAPVVSEDVDIADESTSLGDAQDSLPVEFSADWRKTEEEAIAPDSEGILELTEKSATVVALSEDAIAPNSEDIGGPATAASELAEVGEGTVIMTDTKLETPDTPAKKRGKQPPREIKKLIEAKLTFGQQVTADELAGIIDGTASGIRARRKGGKLHEWGIRSVSGSKPELFERDLAQSL